MPVTPFYNWFGLNQTLFFAINGIHNIYLDQLMLLGSKLGNFWNFPWIIGALILSFAVRTVASGIDHTGWLPERKTIIQLLLTLAVRSADGLPLEFHRFIPTDAFGVAEFRHSYAQFFQPSLIRS